MKRRSEELIDIDGKKYTRYECKQLQRKIETKIRKLKDRKAALKAAGDDVGVRECNRKIRLLKDKYNEITQKAGLDPHYDRMSVVKSGKTVDFATKSGIIKSGANYGAYTNENDPDGEKRKISAENFYKETLNRDREYEIEAVSRNTGYSRSDVDKVFAHVFELEHSFEDGTIHRFDPDYYMQHSWMRLREGKSIQPHDITLLNHELAEANIMGTGTDVIYEIAHAEVEQTYNYTKELLEYLKTHDA